MNICILHRYPLTDISATNPSFIYFLQELVNKKNKVSVITFRGEKKENKLKNVKFHQLSFFFKRTNNIDKWIKSILFILIVPFKVQRLDRHYKFDIVYCDDSLPFYAYLIKKFSGIKTIMRLGDLQIGYLFLKKTKLHNLLFKIFHKIEVHTWKKIDGIIPISKPFERYVISKGIDQKKIITVLECVDTNIFKSKKSHVNIRAKYNLSENDIILMYHGVIEPLKGLDTLLKFMVKILKQNKNVKLFIVGDGSSLSELKIKAKNLGIYNSIIFTGWISFPQIVDYINSCDIGIPMRSDNFANNFVVTSALLQYWACEKPILAPKLEAISDIVEDGKNGFLFSFEDPDEFKSKLGKLIEDPKLRENMGRRGRELVARGFDKQKVAKKLSNSIRYFLDLYVRKD